MSTAQTGLTVLPDWGSYSYNHIGLYYLLDKDNFYGLTFPLSIKVNSTRHNGKIADSILHDQLYHCDRYDPSGNYFRLNYPLSKFGSSGVIYAEFCKYSDTGWFVKISCTNSSSSQISIELSLMGSAHAKMLSYSEDLIQNYIESSGSHYVGMSWTSQSTKVALIKGSDNITPQDIKDSNFVNGLNSTDNPYEGNGLGRTCRAKLSFNLAANSSVSKVFAISVSADETTASTEVDAILSGYSTVLNNSQSKYLINRSVLCRRTNYGDLVERILAELMHFVKYKDHDDDGTWKLIQMPGSSYSLVTNTWYNWDNAFATLAYAEAGYMHIAKDLLNFPYGTDGTYKSWANPPIFPYVIWRMYQITNDKTIISSYYTAIKARYDEFKQWGQVNGYCKWGDRTDGGMDNLPIWTSTTTSAANKNVDPYAQAIYILTAGVLKNMATVLGNGDVSTYATDITNWKAKLETLWDSQDNYYYPKKSDDSYSWVRIKSISSILALLADGLTLEKLDILESTYFDSFSNGGDVYTVLPSDPEYLNSFWNGPSWMPTNFMVALGFRINGRESTAKYIEKNVLDNWNDNNSDNFRELRGVNGTFGGTTHFCSFTSLLLVMFKNSQVKREVI